MMLQPRLAVVQEQSITANNAQLRDFQAFWDAVMFTITAACHHHSIMKQAMFIANTAHKQHPHCAPTCTNRGWLAFPTHCKAFGSGAHTYEGSVAPHESTGPHLMQPLGCLLCQNVVRNLLHAKAR